VSTLNSFDFVAPYYDRLAGLVFGSSIKDAQRAHLPEIKQGATILILGGGTGWILSDLLKINDSANIIYVEASARMILLARENVSSGDSHRVTFIHGTETTLDSAEQFDAVIINFFADMFTPGDLTRIVQRLETLLKADGVLICTDFVNDARWHRVMLKVMYTFFRVATRLQTRDLPHWRDIITTQYFRRVRSAAFRSRFILSELYQKIT
jgi:ubiquinone/menaquinone biosynthesis C-methylase UbiE